MELEDFQRLRREAGKRDPDLLDRATDHEVLILAAGLCLVLAALGLVLTWR